ncbi:hypothetical protein [Oerskovia paurometabola]|uniref:hypothetical protein n=1 Tax=Oerskovia paurometabola TaxID=162170 RepID=UPI0037F315D4
MMFEDETLMELETDVRMTGLGLYVYVDDHGRGSATPRRVRSSLWPLSETITTDRVAEHLEWLEQAGFLQLYEAEGRRYLSILEWPSQDHPKASVIPAPPRGPTLSTSSRRPLDVLGVEEREREERAREGGRGGGERASESEEGAAPAVDPSTPFCPKHPSGTYGKCGPCGTARRAHDAWLKQQTDDARTDLDDDEDDR